MNQWFWYSKRYCIASAAFLYLCDFRCLYFWQININSSGRIALSSLFACSSNRNGLWKERFRNLEMLNSFLCPLHQTDCMCNRFAHGQLALLQDFWTYNSKQVISWSSRMAGYCCVTLKARTEKQPEYSQTICFSFESQPQRFQHLLHCFNLFWGTMQLFLMTDSQ